MPTLSEAEVRQLVWSLKKKGIRISVRSYSAFKRPFKSGICIGLVEPKRSR